MPDLSGHLPDDGPGAAIVRAISDGIVVLDDEGAITWVNRNTVEEFDLADTREQLVGRHVAAVLHPDDVASCLTTIEELRRAETPDRHRCEVRLGDENRSIPVELALTILPAAESFDGTVGVFRDVRRRRQRQERLTVLTRLLRHNLRTKVNVISGRLELLEDDVDPDDAHHVEAIYDALRDLSDLSEKTLEVHRTMAETGGSASTTDAVATVESTVENVRDRFPEADVSMTTPDSAPVVADRTLYIVLENLLENAAEHADREEPRIWVTVASAHGSSGTQSPADRVEIVIEDDGPGIPPKEIEPLASGRETPLRHGSGLGLWLVKWVVDGFGGELQFEEREPRGTTVRVRLDAAGDLNG